MATDTYNFILAAKDNASATIARVKGEVGALGPAAAKTAGPLGTLSAVTGGLVSPLTLALGATAALAAGFGASVSAAREDATSQALLGASLKANIANWDGNTDAIEDVISSRMRLGFADDVQRDSLRQLIAVTKDSEDALALQRTAMDLARLKGIDLATASTILGKVYAGNTSILSRYGIQLEKGATAQEALAEIQRRSAGQAEAYGETLDGQIEALGITFGELAEKVGYVLIPALTGLVNFLNDDLIPTIEKVVGAIGDMWSALDPTDTTPEEIENRFNRAFDGIGVSFDDLGGKAEEVAPTINAAFVSTAENVQAAFSRSYERIREDAAAQLGELPGEIGDAIVDNLPDLKDSMKELREMMQHELDPQTRIHRLQGMLNSRALANGMTSEDPYVRARAREIRQGIRAEIQQLKILLPEDGEGAIHNWGVGMRRRKVEIAQTAAELAKGVRNNLEFDASGAGESVADTWISGVATGIRAGVGVINEALLWTKMNSIGGSLPRSGPLSASKLQAAARSVAGRYTDELSAGLRSGLAITGIGAGAGAMGGGGAVGAAPLTINFHSTFPPTPAQARQIARDIGPELTRWQRRNTH